MRFQGVSEVFDGKKHVWFALFQVICSTTSFFRPAAILPHSIHFRSFALNILDRHAIKKLTLMGLATLDAHTSLNFKCVYLSVFGWRFWHTAMLSFTTKVVVKFYTRCTFVTERRKVFTIRKTNNNIKQKQKQKEKNVCNNQHTLLCSSRIQVKKYTNTL